ncbi:MAG: hypothetical protein KAI16_02665 [Candidatus Pacebacteria bacterium]|nr:hypothetical protein [Candidatus Paceibacterota bacterium]
MLGIGDAAKKMKDKVKQAAMKKMLEKQMKQLSPQQRTVIMEMLQKNPEFFENIAKEIEQEVKAGKNQMAAAMYVMKKHQAEMQKMMMGSAGVNPKAGNRSLQ